MKKLSKEKRSQLIMVMLLIGAVLVGLYFGLIRFQQTGLSQLADQQRVAQGKVDQVQRAIRSAKEIEAELDAGRAALDEREKNMAQGDKFLWMIDFIRKFENGYRVEIPRFETASISEVTLLPKFPYKQISLSISGTGFYHDIGKFIADFENQFPASRVLNLDLQPAAVQVNENREKLSFRMDIVTLIKPDTL